MLNVGEKAPDFELLNQDGKTVRLSDFKGKKLIIFAFPKAGTGGCTAQACGFRDKYPKIEAGNATVLGISPDLPEALKKWQNDESIPYDLLSDPNHEIIEAWGAWGERSMYGRKYMGVIRSHWVIDEDGVVIDEQIKISPADSVSKGIAAVS